MIEFIRWSIGTAKQSLVSGAICSKLLLRYIFGENGNWSVISTKGTVHPINASSAPYGASVELETTFRASFPG